MEECYQVVWLVNGCTDEGCAKSVFMLFIDGPAGIFNAAPVCLLGHALTSCTLGKTNIPAPIIAMVKILIIIRDLCIKILILLYYLKYLAMIKICNCVLLIII